MNGKFYKKSCDEKIKTVEYDLHKDSTLFSVYNFGNYELLLGDGYHISIGIDKNSCKCLSVYCLLDALPFKKIKMDFLTDTYKHYDLIYTSNNLNNMSGEHYTPFERKCYYDSEKSILAFGDIYSEGEIISFNSNTFAKLKEQELLTVFIKVSNDVIDYIENKNKKAWKLIPLMAKRKR